MKAPASAALDLTDATKMNVRVPAVCFTTRSTQTDTVARHSPRTFGVG